MSSSVSGLCTVSSSHGPALSTGSYDTGNGSSFLLGRITNNLTKAPIAESNTTPPMIPPTTGPIGILDLTWDAGDGLVWFVGNGLGWLRWLDWLGAVIGGGEINAFGLLKSAPREGSSQSAFSGLQQILAITLHNAN